MLTGCTVKSECAILISPCLFIPLASKHIPLHVLQQDMRSAVVAASRLENYIATAGPTATILLSFFRFDKEALTLDETASTKASNTAQNAAIGTLSPFKTFTDQGISTSLSKLRGYNFNISFGAQVNAAVAPIGIEGGLSGTFG